jgi:hypothetical protein
MRRRSLLLVLALTGAGCAGGAPSRLVTLGTPSGRGEIDFRVENRSASVVNNLYLVESSRVAAAPREALLPGALEQSGLWGDDLLRSGLEVGGQLRVPVPAAGRYDVRVVDRNGREQHVAGLRLVAGGRYTLELEEGGWRAPR